MANLLADIEWKVGDKCYALFSEDELWYPATIKKVQGSVYTVEYDVYGNEEERIIDEIEEVEVIEGENGDTDRYEHYERTRHLFEGAKPKTKEKAKKEKKSKEKEITKKNSNNAPRMPPVEFMPPPPPGADDDLCQLLMSFFVAGYRTGVYSASH